MIGTQPLHIGPAFGPQIGVAGASLPIMILGGVSDSNGVGQDVAPDEWDETLEPTVEVAELPWRMKYSQAVGDGVSDPPYQTNITTGGVRLYAAAGVQNSGWRQGFAGEAKRAGVSWKLADYAVSGIKALQSTPAANFPTGSTNIWGQMTAWADASEAAFSARTRGTVDFIGGNDGFDAGEAAACQANLTAIVNGKIAKWGSGIKIALVRQPDFQGIASTVPQLATIQAAQDAVAAAFPNNVILIPTADTKGHSDHLHYDGDSSDIVGQRAFWALFDAFGLARPRPATTPQIIGWGPQYITIAAADYSPIPPGCGIAGDLEILIAITQSAAGSNTRINTPTVAGGGTAWTALNDVVLGDTQIQSSQTTTSRLGIWARAVTANRATTATPLTTVPNNGLTINGGRIITVRGPNALTTANIDVIRYSVNNAFQTGLTLTGGTTGFANEGILAIAGGYRTNATSNPVTMSGGNVSGLARAFGGNRAAGGDFITNAAWQASLAAAGATGNITATFTLATLGVGAILGVKP